MQPERSCFIHGLDVDALLGADNDSADCLSSGQVELIVCTILCQGASTMLQRTASMELIGAISIAAQGWLQGVLERGPTYAALRNGDIAGARAPNKG